MAGSCLVGATAAATAVGVPGIDKSAAVADAVKAGEAATFARAARLPVAPSAGDAGFDRALGDMVEEGTPVSKAATRIDGAGMRVRLDGVAGCISFDGTTTCAPPRVVNAGGLLIKGYEMPPGKADPAAGMNGAKLVQIDGVAPDTTNAVTATERGTGKQVRADASQGTYHLRGSDLTNVRLETAKGSVALSFTLNDR